MKIVGIVLLMNEDVFVEQCIRNIEPFCDEIIVADESVDNTPKILERLRAEFPEKIRLHRLNHPRESHPLVRGYANTHTWVFGVDGDEIYDPEGLMRFRKRLEAGEFDSAWAIFGNVFNICHLDDDKQFAEGYLAPPCRSMTKLYNFRAITDWSGECKERMHGGEIHFKEGWNERDRLDLYKQVPWEEADFRCVHTCFLRRSSLEPPKPRPRSNIMDRMAWDVPKLVRRIWAWVTRQPAPVWKLQVYNRGPLHRLPVGVFFQQPRR